MSLSNYVPLSIVQDTVGVTRLGFGTIGILSHTASFAERVRYYSSLQAVGDDFATDEPEYLSAKSAFSQVSKPDQVAVLRADGAIPTQKYDLAVVVARDNHKYEIEVKGVGVTATTVSIDSGSGATLASIAGALVTALNGITGKNFTAVDNADGTFTVTGDAAGNWFSLRILEPGDLSNKQTHVDPGIAAELDAIQLAQPDWYGLHTLYNSEAYVLAAAAWCEAETKIYEFDSVDTDDITTATTGSSGLLDTWSANNYSRSAGNYYPDPSVMMSAAHMGKVLPQDPGSVTWKYQELSGVSAVKLTGTHRKNIVDRDANSFEEVAGKSITFNGVTGDGDFIDVRRGLDWLQDDMSKAVFGVLVGAKKIPYTDAGVAVIENEVRGSLRRAVRRGILAANPEPEVTVPAVADVSTANKSARTLPDVKFTGTLAGAIHKVNIDGVVSV